MALEKEYMVVPFIGGLDEGKDSHVVTQPLLKSSINFESTKEGALRVRPGSTLVAAAGPGDPRLFRYKDGAFVLSKTEFGSLDTETSQYNRLGDVSLGYQSDAVLTNDRVDGSFNCRVARLGDRVVVLSNSLNESGQHVLSFAAYNPDTKSLVQRGTLPGDAFLLDACYQPVANVVVVAARTMGAIDRGIRFYTIAADFTVAEIHLAAATVDAALTTPAASISVRQCQLVPGTGNEVRWVANWLAGTPGTTAAPAATQWGATCVGRFAAAGAPDHALREVSDGTTATYDGTGMVAVGFRNGITHVATCSRIDGAVRVWFVGSGSPVPAPSSALLVLDAIRGYGPMWIAATPSATPQVWQPNQPGFSDVDGSATDGTRLGFLDGRNGCAHNTTFAHGHSTMFGWLHHTGDNLFIGWHGVLTWKTPRTKVYEGGAGAISQIDYGKLVGCHVARLDQNLTTVQDVQEIHGAHLLGRPVEVGTSALDIPCAAASKWYYTVKSDNPDVDLGVTSGFLALREQIGDSLEREDGLQYSCGYMVRQSLESGFPLSTISAFSPDDVAPNTTPYPSHVLSYLKPEAGEATKILSEGLTAGEIVGHTGSSSHYFKAFARFEIHTCGAFRMPSGRVVVGAQKWANADPDKLLGGPRGSIRQPSSNTASAPATTWEGYHPYVAWDFQSLGRQLPWYHQLVSGFHVMEEPPPVAADASEYVIVQAGSPHVFDGTNLFPWMWYVPPQPVLACLAPYSGKDGASGARQMRVQACWAYEDADGVMWRSAPSLVTDHSLHRWRIAPAGRMDADANISIFDRPPPLPEQMRGKLAIEYYTTHPLEEPESGITGDGPMALWARTDASEGISDAYRKQFASVDGFGVWTPPTSTGTADASGNMSRLYELTGLSLVWWIQPSYNKAAPLIYTTGGVLEDEPPIGANYMTFAGGRVWYIRDGRAYYSKTVSKGKPIGFNANLYVDAPNGDELVAISHLDENIVVFSKTGVFVCVGTGPNDLGSGPSYQAVPVASPVGCYNPASVLSTEVGVFFAGPRTLYLLRRDMNVVRIGNIEESLDVPLVRFAFQDRTENRFFWYVDASDASAGHFVVFEAERGLWHKWVSPQEVDVTSGLWTVNGTYYAQENGAIRRVDENATRFSASLTTGWIHLGQTVGYKRFRNGYLSLKTNAPAIVAIAHSYDYEDASVESSLESLDGSDGTRLVRWKPRRQKCASYAMSVQVAPSGANAQLSLTHLGVEVGAKALGTKIPRGAV